MEKNWDIIRDHGIIDKGDNKLIAIREVSWYGKDPKLEIGTWYNGADSETPDKKRITFLTKQGPHNLTERMVDLGYGDTDKLQESIDKRSTQTIIPPTDIEIDDDVEVTEEDDSEYFSSKDILEE